ncbi:MAG TPA: toll/interleukin-1 receptor domain-containing protein [Thermoanaerobaculia bacterium]|nr:toll/interleukin-1 receptor domain-containing protein [Thermoanaerobaculia bacterium]
MNAERPPERSANIFINYRREDSAGHTGRLFDRLSNRFPGRVFMDIDTIEPGVDFAEVITQAVGSCEILIVVIGREWLKVTDADGRRRLDKPGDFVRMEVAAALERNIRVVPVLVEDAPMPRPEDLPEDLAKLARRNAIELSDARWAFDVDRLIQTVERVLQEKTSPAPTPEPPTLSPPALSKEIPRSRTWIALSALLVVLILAGWTGWRLVKPPVTQKVAEIAAPQSPAPAAAPLETSPAVPEEPPQPVADPEPQPPQEETANAPEEAPAPEPEEQAAGYGRNTCKQGFVWREARQEDLVCVTPDIRKQTAEDNLQADARRDPAGGPYGPDTCLSGYVWREAFDGDVVCVTPATRDQALLDNSKANERRMRSLVRWTKSLRKKG